MVLACLAVIEERCKGNLSFTHASLQPIELLPDDEAGIEAYASYLDQLTEFDQEQASAAVRSKTTSDAITSNNPKLGLAQISSTGLDPMPLDNNTPSTLKCSTDHLDPPAVSISSNSSINESLFTWADIPIPSSILHPDIARTLALKANYIIDARHAKNDLIVRADCPNFPDTLWLDVLLDRFIDLDRV